MANVDSPAAGAPPAIRYIAGDPSLDFVNTVAWLPDGFTNERLSDYGRLIEWSQGADLLSPKHATSLRRHARANPAKAAAALRKAKLVRTLLQKVFASRTAPGSRVAGLDEFNAALGDAVRHLEIDVAAGDAQARHTWTWRGLGEDLLSPLWPVLWAAAQLLTSADADRIRMCAGPGCGWMYVDRSRNQLRRWCEMSVCGTLEKSRRRAARHSTTR